MAIRERRKRIYRKRIPYGMQNFEDIRERDCYYVDKTSFIEDIEDSNMYFFYIRPRRFGKSLTLSMLEHYYDINKRTSLSPSSVDCTLARILRQSIIHISSFISISLRWMLE